MTILPMLLSYRNIYCVTDDRLVASRPEFIEITIVTADIPATKTNSPTLDYNVANQAITYKFRLRDLF
jgi:hypothetical protein